MAFLDSLNNFIMSPQGEALAQGFLRASMPGPQGGSLGQGLMYAHEALPEIRQRELQNEMAKQRMSLNERLRELQERKFEQSERRLGLDERMHGLRTQKLLRDLQLEEQRRLGQANYFDTLRNQLGGGENPPNSIYANSLAGPGLPPEDYSTTTVPETIARNIPGERMMPGIQHPAGTDESSVYASSQIENEDRVNTIQLADSFANMGDMESANRVMNDFQKRSLERRTKTQEELASDRRAAEKERSKTFESQYKDKFTQTGKVVEPSRKLKEAAEKNMELVKKLNQLGYDMPRTPFGKGGRMTLEVFGGNRKAQDIADLIKKNQTFIMADLTKSLGGRPNQWIEQQLSKAAGEGLTNAAQLELYEMIRKEANASQYQDRFMKQYLAKHKDLEGADEAYEAWLETNPFNERKKSYDSWKSFVKRPERNASSYSVEELMAMLEK